MRPIAGASYETVFDGIVVNVIDVPRVVVVVANCMLPISSLPKGEFAVDVALDDFAPLEQTTAKVSFDAPPSSRKVCIVDRQGENSMQMIR